MRTTGKGTSKATQPSPHLALGDRGFVAMPASCMHILAATINNVLTRSGEPVVLILAQQESDGEREEEGGRIWRRSVHTRRALCSAQLHNCLGHQVQRRRTDVDSSSEVRAPRALSFHILLVTQHQCHTFYSSIKLSSFRSAGTCCGACGKLSCPYPPCAAGACGHCCCCGAGRGPGACCW